MNYKREMRHNYLILEAMEDNPESFEVRMLAGNVIEGLLRFRLKQEDRNRYYYYEITSKQPLSRLLEFREIRRDELRQLIFGIGEALGWIENYLLQESHVLLEPEYIYIEPETFHVWLCYVPGYPGDFPAAMGRLLHYLLKKADHRDNDTVVLAYRLYQESQKDYYGIDDLLRVARESGMEAAPYAGELKKEGGMPGEKESAAYAGIQEDKEGELYSRPDFSGDEIPSGICSISPEKKRVGWKRMLLLFPVILLISQAGLWFFRGKEGLLRYGILLGAAETTAALCALLVFAGISVYEQRKDREEKTQLQPEEMQWSMVFAKEEDEKGVGNTGNLGNCPREPGEDAGSAEFCPPPSDAGFPVSDAVSAGNTVLLSELQGDKSGNHILKSLDPLVADIPIPYFPFLIGKQEGIVDYVLPKDTVSRLHLRIDQDENTCSITDLNSSNGTKVKEHLLNANESCELNSGDKVIIADISFVFY